MSADLGEFKGLPITGQSVALKNAGDGFSKALKVRPTSIEPGDEFDVVMRVKAGNVMMRMDDIDAPSSWTEEIMLNAQTIAIVDREFTDETISAQRSAEAVLREREKAKKGIVPISGMELDKGPLIKVDGNGVQIIGEAEIQAARERGEIVVETTPVIAEYGNDQDQRRMWPDEFDKGDARPRIGDDDPWGPVTALIDPTTGDVLEPSAEKAATTDEGGGDDDALIGDAPAADVSHPAAAGDVDPAIIDFLEGPVADVKARIAGQLSAQLLKGALDVELATPNTPRVQVVNALKRRIEELEF